MFGIYDEKKILDEAKNIYIQYLTLEVTQCIDRVYIVNRFLSLENT